MGRLVRGVVYAVEFCVCADAMDSGRGGGWASASSDWPRAAKIESIHTLMLHGREYMLERSEGL